MLEGHERRAKSPEQTAVDQVKLQHNWGWAYMLSSHTNTCSDESHAGLADREPNTGVWF